MPFAAPQKYRPIPRKPVSSHMLLDLNDSSDQRNGSLATKGKGQLNVGLLMVFSYLAALVFAIIHHCFYTHWNAKPVGSEYQQRWITRGGTAFAFAFKMFLVIAVGASYVQHLWLSLRRKPFRADQINEMFNILSNPLSFASPRLWIEVPILITIALTSWLIPIAAIVTPGTIVLGSEVKNSTSRQSVPALNFSTQFSLMGLPTDREDLGYVWTGGPSDHLLQMTLTTAVSGSIIPMHSVGANISWSLDFWGPGLVCQPDMLNNTQWMEANYSTIISGNGPLIYFSWVGGLFDNNTRRSFDSQGGPSSNAAHDLQMYVFQRGCYNSTQSTRSDCSSLTTISSSLVFCSLKNVTYSVGFDIVNQVQKLTVQRRDVLNEVDPVFVVGRNQAEMRTDVVAVNEYYNYLSLMSAFKRIMAGSIWDGRPSGIQIVSTMIGVTSLAPQLLTIDGSALANACELLFTNVTMSLFSWPEILGTPQDVDVTKQVLLHVYQYNARDIFTAYGVALLCGVACLAIGYSAMRRNGASYDTDFTTIMRTTQSIGLSEHILSDHSQSGANPLPKHVKELYLQYGSGDHNGGKAGFSLGQRRRKL